MAYEKHTWECGDVITAENNRSNAFAMKWDGTFVFADGTEITPDQFASILASLA